VRVYADGRVVEIRPAYPSFEAEFRQLLLTGSGVEALLGRIKQAGVAAGCRSLFADADDRSMEVTGPDGVAAVWWGRDYRGVRPLGDLELASLDRLAVDVGDPASWLAPSDLATSVFEPFVPNRWRVHVQVTETGLLPGESIQTAGGMVFDGANPAFANLRLPGDVPPEQFGEPEGDDERIRCGEVDADEAASVVASLAAARADHVPNDVWEVFSEDLSTSYIIQVMAMLSEAEGCAMVTTNPVQPASSPTARAAADEDLAQVDPCTLIAAGVAEVASGEPARQDSTLPFDGRSSACSIPAGEGYGAIEVTLRSRSTGLDEARWWVEALFGPRAVEVPVEGGIAWENACLVEDLSCERATALLVRAHLLVIRLQTAPEDTSVDIRELSRDLAATIASGPQ
jgi:hypothetical protein